MQPMLKNIPSFLCKAIGKYSIVTTMFKDLKYIHITCLEDLKNTIKTDASNGCIPKLYLCK